MILASTKLTWMNQIMKKKIEIKKIKKEMDN